MPRIVVFLTSGRKGIGNFQRYHLFLVAIL